MKVLINKFLGKLGYKIEKRRTQDDLVLATQKKLLGSNKPLIIFDVGGHIGEIAIKYSKAFHPQSQVYTFEPFAESFELLKNNTKGYANIHPINKALGDTTGETLFNINSFSATNSLLDTDPEGIKNWGTGLLETQQRIKIPIQRIDDFMEEHQLDRIDILKMDTQGSEYKVLEGAAKSIATGKIKLIYTEMIVMPTYKEQKELDEMLQLMRNYGYLLYNLYHSFNSDGQLRFMDGIFIYKD